MKEHKNPYKSNYLTPIGSPIFTLSEKKIKSVWLVPGTPMLVVTHLLIIFQAPKNCFFWVYSGIFSGSKLQWHLCNSLAVIFCCLKNTTQDKYPHSSAGHHCTGFLSHHRHTLQVMAVTGWVSVRGNSASKMGLRGEAFGRGEGQEPGTRHCESQPSAGRAQLQNS